MYTEDYERRGFPLRSFLQKLILVIVFALILVWLLPKFISPRITATSNQKSGSACTNSTCDTSGIDALTSQIFADNLDKMKQAAISYYTDERLPKNIGESNTMTLSDMIGKKLLIALIDKNNKACDVEKSYVKITKLDNEYTLKVNLKDSEKEDYILVHLGCYHYCEGAVCEKQGTATPTKGSKTTGYVPIKGSVEHGTYVPPKKPTPVVPVPEKTICGYRDGQFYDTNGNPVSKEEYIKQCMQPVEIDHYCGKYNNKYYDDKGNVVSYEDFKKACVPEDKHYCVKFNNKYYDDKGNVVSYENYKKACVPEDKHYCVKYDGKFYDKEGKIVNEVNYIISCQNPKCKIVNKYYFDKKGNQVDRKEYEKQCVPKEYLYEYQKTTAAKFSEWTKWSSWQKADCATKEINCNDASTTCLNKLQMLKRKEQIGTYEKTYAKQRDVIVQTGSYTSRSCSNYNYVEINKTVYATAKTTKYTQVNTITAATKRSVASWTYTGRVSYSTVPKDTATTIYKYVGADYSKCAATCATAPSYYYDVYVYAGKVEKVSNTLTAARTITASTTTSTSVDTTKIGYEASCGEVIETKIPIYSTITVTEKAKRNEPLYGDVCYKSTKSRTLISDSKTNKKWSTYNDKTLLNDGWTYTGRTKEK